MQSTKRLDNERRALQRLYPVNENQRKITNNKKTLIKAGNSAQESFLSARSARDDLKKKERRGVLVFCFCQ